MPSTLRAAMREHHLTNRYAEYFSRWSVHEWEPGCWWILDGEIKVGVVVRGTDLAELVNFDPFNPRRDVSFPGIYHAPTQPGDRVTMATWINSQSTVSHRNGLRFSIEQGGVTATFSERWEQGRRACKRLTWKVDADFGYVLHVEAEMTSPILTSHPLNTLPEYCNFLPQGATDDRPEWARYPFVLWQHPSGRIVRRNQNNIGTRALGALDVHDRRRIQTGGFIGYFGEEDRSSAIEILESNPGSTAMTCPNLLDEHLVWLPPEVERPPQNSNGEFSYRAAFNLVSVPPVVGDALTSRAEMLDIVLDRYDSDLEAKHAWCHDDFPQADGAPKSLNFCSLTTGVVSDFETQMDAASIFRGQVFPYAEDANEPISVVSDCAHSGRRSLRLQVDGEAIHATAKGNCLHVTQGQKYRLSAWVKTELEEGEATLSAVEFIFNLGNISATHWSTPVVGREDWRQVEVEFTPGEMAHVVEVRANASGRGAAWFDDILLEKIH